jgi:bifunctional enzyme CysN/CysC
MLDREPRRQGSCSAEDRELLRFLTCGSVDDGKSTLIGRLLHDSELIPSDQLAMLKRDSRKSGSHGEDLDFALLLDGLEAEREQGITIDVAYRYFATDRRSFIVADAPGHEQYTRNMATGASNSELAIILVDARKGVLPQTRRHAMICSLLGIRHIILAVNKVDLTGYSAEVFDRIVAEFAAFASRLSFSSVVPIAISARFGDNVVRRSRETPWYRGPALVEHLETVDVATEAASKPFRFAVQWVNRANLDFRGFAGRVCSGRVRTGDRVVVATSGATSKVARIVTAERDLDEADSGEVTLTLDDEIDVSRGDLLVHPHHRPDVADQFAAHILWMGEEALLPGRSYLMRIGTKWTPAIISSIKHRVGLERLEPLAARTLHLNDIAFCNISTTVPIACDRYEDNRDTGAFILVDRVSNETVGAGMISFALRRASNVHREMLAVERAARAQMKHQKPCIIWFTGLSASGKSTVAKLVELKLHGMGHHTYMIDGDNLRHGLTKDLGFTDADRVENVRRTGEVAKLFVDAGLIVLCTFISPFRAERRLVRELVAANEFIEVFVDTPISECMRRDPKGLYAKALSGTIKNFTGVDSVYEAPHEAELVLRTTEHAAGTLAERVVAHLRSSGYLA